MTPATLPPLAAARAGAAGRRSGGRRGGPARRRYDAAVARGDATEDARKAQSGSEQPVGDRLQIHANDLGDVLTLKVGPLFLLTQSSGDIPAPSARTGRHGLGLYFRDTRYLDERRLHLNGRPMTLLLAAADIGDRGTRELTNPELALEGGAVLRKETIGLHVDTTIDGGVREVLTFRNFGRVPVPVTLTLAYGSHFDDIFTVRGLSPGRRGRLYEPQSRHGSLCLRYDGADDRRRTTRIGFEPRPAHLDDRCARFPLTLQPGESSVVTVTITIADEPLGTDPGPPEAGAGLRPVAEPGVAPRGAGLVPGGAQVETSNELFNRVLRRSFLDLEMLETQHGDDRFFAAGVPWYVALFGRDSIITALETLAFSPELARTTLDLLARYQGTVSCPERDEEPGKILHELRVGERARLGEVPFTPYYGTIDSTPLFLILVGEYLQWTGDLRYFATMQPHVEAALTWLERYGDRDGDGWLEYAARASKGLFNQGWKDSQNAIVNADGSLAEPPIALVEVQGYVYRAYRTLGQAYRVCGNEARATQLQERADALRAVFDEQFWVPDLGNYALALQGERGSKRPAAVDASNQGQALWGGIVSPGRAGAVRDSLMDPERLFAGWGLRTLSKAASSYNPFDYQTGAVWPHDSALVAVGLRSYGFDEEALRVFTGMYEAATRFDLYRLPELFAGFGRERYGIPVRYPVACAPQAWAAGSLPYLLTAVLGLVPDAFERRLHVVRPCLPDWLDWVEVRGVRVGAGEVDLRYERSGATTLVAALRKTDDVQVRIEY